MHQLNSPGWEKSSVLCCLIFIVCLKGLGNVMRLWVRAQHRVAFCSDQFASPALPPQCASPKGLTFTSAGVMLRLGR